MTGQGNLDAMLNTADTLAAGGQYQTYERAILGKQHDGTSVGMLRVRLLQPFAEFFELWCEQQPGPGIQADAIGKPRRIVSKGWKRTQGGSYEHLCPLSQTLNDYRDSDDPALVQLNKDWRITRFFAFNVAVQDLHSGEVDPWCLENGHAKLLTLHRSTYGIKAQLFQAIADELRVQKGYNPNITLDGIDLVLTRTGTGLNTEYGCSAPPNQTTLDVAPFQKYNFDEITQLTPVAMMQQITGIDLGVAANAAAHAVNADAPGNPVAAQPQTGQPVAAPQAAATPTPVGAPVAAATPSPVAAGGAAVAPAAAPEMAAPPGAPTTPVVAPAAAVAPPAAPIAGAPPGSPVTPQATPTTPPPATVAPAAPAEAPQPAATVPQGNAAVTPEPAAAAPAPAPAQEPAPVAAEPAAQACPHCGTAVTVPEALLGKTVACPSCAQQFETAPF